MKIRFILLFVLLSACNEPTMDASSPESLWASYQKMAARHPGLAPALEQAILDIRNHAEAGTGSAGRRVEILGMVELRTTPAEQVELVIRAALDGKTAEEVIELAQALRHGDEDADKQLMSPVYF